MKHSGEGDTVAIDRGGKCCAVTAPSRNRVLQNHPDRFGRFGEAKRMLRMENVIVASEAGSRIAYMDSSR